MKELLKHAHAFLLQVGNESETHRFWSRVFPKENIVKLPNTKVLPQVQAAIIGLTEGTLSLENCEQFLKDQQVSETMAKDIVRAIAHIPVGAQAALPNFGKLPKKGDLFASKTEVWPVESGQDGEAVEDSPSGSQEDEIEWA